MIHALPRLHALNHRHDYRKRRWIHTSAVASTPSITAMTQRPQSAAGSLRTLRALRWGFCIQILTAACKKVVDLYKGNTKPDIHDKKFLFTKGFCRMSSIKI